MRDDVLAELADPVRSTVNGVHRGDPLLDALSFGVIQARGHLVGLLVDLLRLHALGQAELDKPGLVEHRDGRAVLDRLGQVVDQLDVLAEDRPRVLARLAPRDRRAGERDERGMRQRVPQVPGVAVEVVVVGAVRLVNDHDDVPPV